MRNFKRVICFAVMVGAGVSAAGADIPKDQLPPSEEIIGFHQGECPVLDSVSVRSAAIAGVAHMKELVDAQIETDLAASGKTVAQYIASAKGEDKGKFLGLIYQAWAARNILYDINTCPIPTK